MRRPRDHRPAWLPTAAIAAALALALAAPSGCSGDDGDRDSGPADATTDVAADAPPVVPDSRPADIGPIADAGVDAEGADAAADSSQDGPASDGNDDATAGDAADAGDDDATADDAAGDAADAGDDAAADAPAADAPVVDLGPVGDIFGPPPDGLGDALPITDGAVYGCGEVPFEGCCRNSVLYYCGNDGLLRVVDCAANPSCGWDDFYELYDCGTDGAADPTGSHAKACPF